MEHLIALVLYGAGAVLCAAGVTNWGLACIGAGLFVQAL